MPIHLHNTVTRKVEEFRPLVEGKALMYHCGPTVYDYVHIGNLRAFLTADLLRRTFEYSGYEVKQVMNITDVGIGGDNDEGEDKIVKGLKREGKEVTMENMKELTSFYADKFLDDITSLGIKTPHALPRASEYIDADQRLISTLMEKGFAYETSDGVYFDVSKDPNYGKLGGVGEDTRARVESSGEKRSPQDFALWKKNESLGFASPWGQGFPGWHIECSAMATETLGPSFDIHTGGIDLAPIHHNNEIAQSENACECEFARFWIHNEFVNTGGSKMAKSEGNVLNLQTLAERGFSPLAYRYFLLQSHYRTPTSFSFEALEASQNAYRRLKDAFATWTSDVQVDSPEVEPRYKEEFRAAIEDDINTPEALAVAWKLAKDNSVPSAVKRATLLDFDRVLGLDLEHNEFATGEVPEEVQELLNKREEARKAGEYTRSDELRDKIKEKGFEVLDTSEGQRLSRK